MSERFSIRNFWLPVSFQQYIETAKKLEKSIKDVNPNTTSHVLLTTDSYDYNGWGSLTQVTPEVEKALDRRRKIRLEELDENLWEQSLETGLYIHDNTTQSRYMITLTTESRAQKELIFYCQSIDKKSQVVFDSFKKTKGLQRLCNGHTKPSEFAELFALRHLN